MKKIFSRILVVLMLVTSLQISMPSVAATGNSQDALQVADNIMHVYSASGITTIGKKNSSIQMKVDIAATYVSDESVTWTSSDNTVATVDDNGLVTANEKNGVVTITATLDENTTVSDSVELTVNVVPVMKETIVDMIIGGSTVIGGGWYDWGSSGAYGGSKMEVSGEGAYFEHKFCGTGVEVYAEKGYNMAAFDVYIDNELVRAGASLKSTNAVSNQKLVFSKTDLKNGEHTIKCVVVPRIHTDGVKTKANVDFLKIYEPQVTTETIIDDYVESSDTYNFQFDSGWKYPNDNCYGGYIVESDTEGAYCEYTFRGTGVEVYGVKGWNYGACDIYIDNELVANDINLDDTVGSRLNQCIFSKTDLENDEHTIKCVVVYRIDDGDGGTKKKVTLDYLKIHEPQIVTETVIDDYVESTDTYNFQFDSGWKYPNDNCYGGYIVESDTEGAYCEYTFRGTGVEVYGVKGWNYGACDIYIDNELVANDINLDDTVGSRLNQCIFSKTDLKDGEHTIKCVVVYRIDDGDGGTKKKVTLDYLKIIQKNYIYTDKAELQDAIVECGKLVEALCTTGSWKLLSDALEVAVSVMNDIAACDADVEEAIEKLNTAKAGLVKSTSYVKYYENITEYRSGDYNSYPVMEGLVFAGWYENEACTTPVVKDMKEGGAYAKFVDAKVLTVKAQVTAGTTVASENTDIRFISTVDSLDYNRVGFYITVEGSETNTVSSTKVYEKLYVNKNGEVDILSPTVFCENSEFFFAYLYRDVQNKSFDTKFEVTPFWITQDGTKVIGEKRIISILFDYFQTMPYTGEFVLPTVFSDGMIFQQNKPMKVWGYGTTGEDITATLYQGKEVIETKTTTASGAGRWDIAFDAREGGYTEYTIDIVTDNAEHVEIKDVLIGELWIACGQSNMEFKVYRDMDSEKIIESANNRYIRMYLEPYLPVDSDTQPIEPTQDIAGANWVYAIKGGGIENVSSLAYTFAKNLQETLQVPIGVIDCSTGGTSIEAWISRAAIEADIAVKTALQEYGGYYAKEDWGYVMAGDMSTLYNQKIGPLEGMNVAGAIWYQGENNSYYSEIYDIELDLLKRSWSRVFGYVNEDMPFIFTQVAPHSYELSNNQHLGYLATYMEQGWSLSKDRNTAMLTIYDLPLDHMKNGESSNAIHPRIKTPVAERFYRSAMNMVYGGKEEYTAPVYESMEIQNDVIYVNFDRVGTGLTTIDGSVNVHGFTIANENGVYVNAQAEIVDTNTVKVWNDFVSNPKHVMYAFDNFNQGANLCNSSKIPASPFRTIKLKDTTTKPDKAIVYFTAQDWMYADKDVWVYDSLNAENGWAGYRPSFVVTGGTYTYDSGVFAEGIASLKVTYQDEFCISPILTYGSIAQSWSNFNTLSVSMFSQKDVEVSLIITSEGVEYVIPTTDGQKAVELICSDTEFQRVNFDLASVDHSVLESFTNVTFRVTGEGAGEMYFDNFSFGL